ncbi:hypothetical protein G6O69_14825 [Pseudenhygromyxa sp. WMMC2535]|uniref:hypothetical protein n=1 Tax=Pseudenhygromyxa sp. WMMC2535 TaxID=2712867 RepID=UPI0015549E67|nr:hypothetical protein [Pseudenhygromyxa sp. WMMC2535]NVB39115.1 hypothetical protein [Pseudenhygromyxa sp. WMMC2535]
MSSTELSKGKFRRLLVAGLVFGVACASSLSFSSSAQAQIETIESEPVAAATTVEVAVVTGALVAYGWLADKTYDLGKEVGKWLAGTTEEQLSEAALVSEPDADYLLN